MKVQFAEIPPEGLLVTVEEQSWFPHGELRAEGPVWAQVRLERKGSRIFVEGEIRAVVLLECDRCLRPFSFPIADRLRIDIELQEAAPEHVAALEWDANEMDTVYVQEPAVDIFDLLEQQVFLQLPVKRLCSPTCRGLCPQCGAVLDREGCDCGSPAENSPFAVLAGKKKE